MRVAVLATGGKDSVLALHHVLGNGHEVAYLVSMIPLSEDSWMFHYPNMHLIDLFAEAIDIPIVKRETSGKQDEEVEDLKRVIEELGVEGVVSGAIASVYQNARIERICEKLRMKCVAPLWHRDPLDVLKEILRLKFEVIMTGVCAHGFNHEWLGRRIDEHSIADLLELNKKYGISLVGEGGEYETLVLNAPLFKKRINILESEKIWKKQSGYLNVKRAGLLEK
jgi:predicted ATP pyrophosphatase (TIGR00289 family)